MTAAPETAAPVLAGLDREQREAVLAARGPVCILAGAGTGKTRTITHRIAHAVTSGSIPPGQLLALTFTARAAGEMRSRLHGLAVAGVQARTFHSAALRQLSFFWPRAFGGDLPQLLEHKARLVGTAATRCRLTLDRTGVRDLIAEIEWAKARLIAPEGFVAAVAAAARDTPRPAEQVAAVYLAYEEIKARQGLIDFDDVLVHAAAAIEGHADVAEQVRARYRHFVVDEYQDVNPAQARLLDAWLGGRDDLCVVGDPNQTIYSFTGASPTYLLDFPRRYPGATVVRLVRDYRSTPQVVGLANRIIAGASGRLGEARLELRAQRPPGPEPTVRSYDDEPAEAAAVAARCTALIADGVRAAEIAVLFRINAQSETFEQALAAEGIPFVVRGGTRFFERPEVRQAVLLLRGAARAADPDAPDGLVGRVRDVLAAAGWTPTAPAGGAARERWESLAALAGLAEQVAGARPDAGLVEFVAELEQRASAQHAPTVDGVTLASLHAAKGLEWDAVFVVGLVEGTLPLVHAVTPEEVEEERRLLYVGITRAREHLALSWSRARAAGGRKSRSPSRFLDGLVPASDRPAARSGRSAGKSAGKAAADALDAADQPLFERLRAWRLERAREQSQPAFCIFTDATLTAIAAARPGSIAELVRVQGVGQAKLDRYAADVLALVAADPASG